MQYQNQALQSHEAEALFTELGENELDAIVGGYNWDSFKRQANNLRRQTGNAASDLGKGGKDGVMGAASRQDNLAYNAGYIAGDILDN